MSLLLRNCNIVDATSPQVRRDQYVLVEGDTIREVGSDRPPTADRTLDLKGSYLLPGLWDAHIHLGWAHQGWPHQTDPTVAEQTIEYGYSAIKAMTDSGVVGIRTAGVPHFIDVALKRAFDAGQFTGPRLFTAGWFLTTTAGHAVGSDFIDSRECDGPYGFARAIREQIKNGVDHIKLNLTGGIGGPSWDRHWVTFPLQEELEAAFAICHQRGYKVMAHATNPEMVKAAIRHGAHTVEHGYIMDEECIGLFLEHDTWYIPTLCVSHLNKTQATTPWEKQWVEEHPRAPDIIKRADDAVEEHKKWFRRALQAGVKMALGSDVRPVGPGTLMEMSLWVKDGASTWQTLVAATKNAAEVCGVGQELGTIEVSKLADLIIVRQNPLDDIDNLRLLELVFKEGRLVADHRNEVD